MDRIKRAIEFTTKKHEGQTRWDKTPYINHPLRVSESQWIQTEDQKLAAIGHDLVEDCDVSYEELVEYFGSKAAQLILTLSHDKENMSYAEYIFWIRKNEDAIHVKLADLEDNLSDLKSGSMKDKYELAAYILLERLEKINKA